MFPAAGFHEEIVRVDKRKLSIILAVVLALVAVVMVRNYISQTEKKYIKEEKKAYVLVATQPIAAGATIDESMMKMEAIPEKYVQPNAINSPSLAAGRRAAAAIAPGEQVMTTKLTLAVKDTSLAMRTPQGKRAITITVPFLSAVGGKIRPGDYVDVIGTFPYNAQIDGRTVTEMVSVTLFQNILVLGVEGGMSVSVPRGQAAPAPTDLIIVLALSPREAALLSFALEQKASLRMILRPPLETAIEPVPPVEVNALWQYVFSNLGQEFMATKEESPSMKPQEKKQEPPAPPTVEIYRGTEKSNMIMNK